jgi:sugar phosphate isomerase/epimerase
MGLSGPLASPLLGRSAAGASSATDKQHFSGDYGLELYSVRKQLAQDIPGTLAMVAKIGYKEVEAVYDNWGHATIEVLGDYVKKAGLKLTSIYYPDFRFRENLEQLIEGNHKVGAHYLICGNIPGAFLGKVVPLDDFKRAAATFNQWAAKVKSAGLQFSYHNHDYEFRLYDGKPAYDTLVQETDPALVVYEMDVFWVKRGGQDPIAYLKRYPNRFRLMHLKDMRRGTETGVFTRTPDDASVALGGGILEWPSILNEARRVGVEKYYVEDESPEASRHLAPSLEYLKSVTL